MSWALLLTALGSLGPYMPLYAASTVAFVTALLLFLALRAFREELSLRP
jgi:hypothetical protein